MFSIEKTSQFQEWILSIKDRVTLARINNRIVMIEKFGHFGDAKSVGGGVYELRLFFGAGYRIYYMHKGNKIILLLCAGDKSTQKTDIKRAIDISTRV